MTIVQPLPEQARRRDDDGSLVARDYLQVVRDAIEHHPRSLQTAIGPSEIGVSCDRRLAYKLLGKPERPQPPNWLATIGTGVHAWLESAFDADNMAVMDAAELGVDEERWLVETRVTPGYVPGMGFITGSCDLYDRATGTVIDHKIVGPTTLKKYKASGPSQQYRVQANLYGLGWENAGHWVTRVMIAFLPRNAGLDGAYLWSAPYEPQLARDALDRLGRIHAATTAVGEDVLPAMPTADVYCSHCPWFAASSTDPRQGCPGHNGAGFHTQAPALTFAG